MIKKFISFYKPYKMLFTLDLFVAFIAALCDLVYPMMTRELINDSIPNQNLRMIVVFAISLLIIFLVKAACGYFMQYWGQISTRRIFSHNLICFFTSYYKFIISFFKLFLF